MYGTIKMQLMETAEKRTVDWDHRLYYFIVVTAVDWLQLCRRDNMYIILQQSKKPMIMHNSKQKTVKRLLGIT
jgi:hypothetical protein